ncbi:MAG TPA: Fe-S cluster assembly protein SufD [Actinomycetota bacterium]|jgi:Fe-S cluster assembly protein SufD|nr:Fe-S cluster assembly protein SufD [Actinomycetota bacterium]
MTDLLTRGAVDALSEALGEPGWLAERRIEAFEIFSKLELPDPKGEEWRYTDVRRFDFERFAAPVPATHDLALDPGLASKGVVFTDFRTALSDHTDLLKEHFFTEVPVDEHKFTALHGAFHSDDILVYIPRGLEVEVPFEMVRRVGSGGSVFPHTTIVVDEQASLTFVDSFISEDYEADALCSSVVEVEARGGSMVNYISLQQWGRNVHHFQTQRFTGGRDTTVRSLAVNLGSTFARTQVESVLRGEGSFSEMLGLYFADADQHFAQRTLQQHNAPHATSDLLYKGALKEKSKSEYSGLIKVAKGAQGTDAYQANRNLTLSDEALARSIPQLEIEANEVRCTHGATVAPVEEEHLFYLMSRGIDRVTAQKLVVFGFFGEVLDRIRVPSVREELSAAISKKVEGEQMLEVAV